MSGGYSDDIDKVVVGAMDACQSILLHAQSDDIRDDNEIQSIARYYHSLSSSIHALNHLPLDGADVAKGIKGLRDSLKRLSPDFLKEYGFSENTHTVLIDVADALDDVMGVLHRYEKIQEREYRELQDAYETSRMFLVTPIDEIAQAKPNPQIKAAIEPLQQAFEPLRDAVDAMKLWINQAAQEAQLNDVFIEKYGDLVHRVGSGSDGMSKDLVRAQESLEAYEVFLQKRYNAGWSEHLLKDLKVVQREVNARRLALIDRTPEIGDIPIEAQQHLSNIAACAKQMGEAMAQHLPDIKQSCEELSRDFDGSIEYLNPNADKSR